MIPEEYKKMVLALPAEFFAGWEWEDGDQVYLTEEIEDYSPSEVHGLYTVFDGLLAHDGILDTQNWLYVRVIDFKNGRPLPSQEQLQKMAMSPSSYFSNDYNISKMFIASVIEGNLIGNIENKTLVEMWLEFIMFLIYGKRWNGEKWI